VSGYTRGQAEKSSDSRMHQLSVKRKVIP